MRSHILLTTLVALSLLAGFSVQAMRHPNRILKRQADLDADQLASASLALSIYNSVGTTAFAAPTAGVCAAGLQAYTSAAGRLRCCVGSIVDDICFSDTEDIIYDADPYAVLAGTEEAPVAAGDPIVPVAGTDTTAVLASTSSRRASSTINYLTATTFTPSATGGTRRGASTAASTSVSQRSLTLTPTETVAPVTSSAIHLHFGSLIASGLLLSVGALVGLVVLL